MSSFNIINASEIGEAVIPGVYIYEAPATPTAVTGTPSNNVGMVGTGSYGPLQVPQSISALGNRASTSAAVQAVFGRSTSDPHSIVDAVANGAAPEANVFTITRVDDTTSTAAFFSMLDGTGFASDTLTVGGTFAAGVALTVTLGSGSNSVPIAYTTQSSDVNLAGVAASLLKVIVASAACIGVNAFVSATVSGAVITLTALASGTAGNSITLSATGTGVTLTAGGANFTGGAAPGVLFTITALYMGSAPNSTTAQFVGGRFDLKSAPGSTSPVYRVTLTAYTGIVEVFDNIIAYATAGGGYSATTFKANVLAAINTGTSQRAPSSYWIATTGSSTAAPLTATTFPAANGTDGASGVGLSQLLGLDGSTGRTGLYSLRFMLKGGTVMIAGLGGSASDVAIAQTLATFAQQEACIAVIALGPAGTTAAQAVATIASYSAASRFLLGVLGEPYFVDPNSGLQQLENPSGAAAGLISSLPPWVSPLNKPKSGIVASEWTVSPQNFDETTMQSNGIGYFKKLSGQWVFFGKTMLDGVTPIEDARMLNYLAPSIAKIGYEFLGVSQPGTYPNATLTNYANDVTAFLLPISAYTPTGQATNNPNPQITAFSIDLSPNTVTTIEGHSIIASIAVQTLSSIWYVYNILQVGNTVQTSAATLLQAAA